MDLLKMRRLLESGKSIFDLQLKVVYYARVSTDRDEQLNSLENQVTYYDNYIKSNENWTFSGGYIDEGISGTSVNKRENFLKMIDDGKNGMFDLIITKEISRFSRSTLDSVRYTQELLEHGVGVYFQSDNINTLYTDAELRLTIMSSIAQDEMRRLSERVKFGMKRAYESGKVLGQNNIYGYTKQNGKLIVNEPEAQFIRDLFQLYGEDKFGFRTVARQLTTKGYKSKSGGIIDPASLKHILTNPKYKGYYHGRLTESNDYRQKKNIKLPDEERLCYKDENIPALVSEELWDRVNRIVTERTEKYKKKGAATQKRFAYSGKIVCEEHNAYHYRKVWKDRKIPAESWCCREYLAKGRVACPTPHLYTKDLDAVLEWIGNDLLHDKEKYKSSVDNLLSLYAQADKGNADYAKEIAKLNKEQERNDLKKRKILDLYTDGDIDKKEYSSTIVMLNKDIEDTNTKIANINAKKDQQSNAETALADAKSFFDELANSKLTATEVAQEMLESVLVRKGSTKDLVKLEIKMKYGSLFPATIARANILYGISEVSPIVGTEKQSEDLVKFLLSEFEEDPKRIWESNIFGKSLHELVNEGLNTKLAHMPDDARAKLSETLERVINEGSNGLVCIIL